MWNNTQFPELKTSLPHSIGKAFTKLDLSQSYTQIPLDENSKTLTTINTQKELFQLNRLPFGISSAPVICQRRMQELLKDISGITIYLDDIVITGRNDQ